MNNKPNIIKIVGLAIGLPSTILGIFFFIYFLIQEKIISTNLGLILIVLVIVNIFYLMIRYAVKK
jgi:hypothetical protein